MRNTWRQVAANRPAVIGVALISLMVITGVAFITAGLASGRTTLDSDGGGWFFAAIITGGPFAYGYWTGRRPRKIRVEEQLDEVYEKVSEVAGMMRESRPVARPELVVHEGGREK